MTKTPVAFLLIYSILLLTLTSPVQTQVGQQAAPAESKTSSTSVKERRPDLKTAVESESRRYARQASVPDVKALERDAAKLPPSPPTGWTQKKTALVVLAVVGLAALAFVLFKYGKECVRTEPAYCSLGTDEICSCVEYKQESK